MVAWLPHLNAFLNAVAALLLVLGWWLIRQRRESAHRLAMLSAFGVSVMFLISYLTYHTAIGGTKTFPKDAGQAVRAIYLAVLVSHSLLAATVPILAVTAIYFAVRDRRHLHRRVARWALPIWLYVSVTGVVVYWMLYHAYG
ncbi:MAG: membrane protein [Pirellulaceae bacterium]|nr:MAG: membrane protein [Pirellulaceae bacterium]